VCVCVCVSGYLDVSIGVCILLRVLDSRSTVSSTSSGKGSVSVSLAMSSKGDCLTFTVVVPRTNCSVQSREYVQYLCTCIRRDDIYLRVNEALVKPHTVQYDLSSTV
jgi:hypothetical protein